MDTHKAYMLIDTNTNKVSFTRYVVVHEKVGPFHTPLEFNITEQLGMARDSGVKLQVTPTKGGEDSQHEESPRSIIDDTNTCSPIHGANTDLDEDPKKRSKWWPNTICDVQLGEMIEG